MNICFDIYALQEPRNEFNIFNWLTMVRFRMIILSGCSIEICGIISVYSNATTSHVAVRFTVWSIEFSYSAYDIFVELSIGIWNCWFLVKLAVEQWLWNNLAIANNVWKIMELVICLISQCKFLCSGKWKPRERCSARIGHKWRHPILHQNKYHHSLQFICQLISDIEFAYTGYGMDWWDIAIRRWKIDSELPLLPILQVSWIGYDLDI